MLGDKLLAIAEAVPLDTASIANIGAFAGKLFDYSHSANPPEGRGRINQTALLKELAHAAGNVDGRAGDVASPVTGQERN